MSVADLLAEGVESGVFPGACAVWGGPDSVEFACAGRHTYEPDSSTVEEDTLWDLASLTKVVATTSVAMILWQEGKLDLDRSVSEYEPRFLHPHITVRDLLTHRSGLPAYKRFDAFCSTPEEAEKALFATEISPAIPPKTIYSCLGFMVLRRVLETAGEAPFAELTQELVFKPLGMNDTGFNPADAERCALTEGQHGVVHDPNARFLGGVSGNAGVFSTIGEMALWCQELVRGGDKIFKPETVTAWTRRQSPSSTRTLGFDTKSPTGSSAGRHFHLKSYGHLGFTGTSVWIDPVRKIFSCLLTNRVYPAADNTRIVMFRPRFNERIFEKLRGEQKEA